MAKLIHVLVPVALDRAYSYRVPETNLIAPKVAAEIDAWLPISATSGTIRPKRLTPTGATSRSS